MGCRARRGKGAKAEYLRGKEEIFLPNLVLQSLSAAKVVDPELRHNAEVCIVCLVSRELGLGA